jgi:CheY-like chemotaxis protein
MNKSILVIDDEEDIRKSFVSALEKTGYQIDTAESGKEGIRKERSKKYDLIFLDLKMPGIDGVEALREIRKVNEETPIYIITAFYQEFLDELNTALKEGLKFELLKKPIIDDQILSVAKSILEGPIAL